MGIPIASHQRGRLMGGVITRIEKATMLATVHKEPKFSELFMSYLLTPEQSD